MAFARRATSPGCGIRFAAFFENTTVPSTITSN
jgi:hypothetical protein